MSQWQWRSGRTFRGFQNTPAFKPEALPSGWMGFGLTCQECGGEARDASRPPVWSFGTLPTVSYVDPEGPSARAGVRRGDQLTHIDGVSLLTDEGGKRFGAVKPGQKIRWRLIRDGRPLGLAVVAAERPGDSQEPGLLRDRLRELSQEGKRLSRSREMTDLARRLGELERLAPEAAPRQSTRRLRYAGSVGGSDIEVRGLGN